MAGFPEKAKVVIVGLGGLVGAAIFEVQVGPDDEIAHRPRHEYLSGARERGDARADVHRDPADVLAPALDLSGVEPGPDWQPERREGVAQELRALHAARGPIEGREHAVARLLHHPAAKPVDASLRFRVVAVEEPAPLLITEPGRRLRRVDDVGEQHG